MRPTATNMFNSATCGYVCNQPFVQHSGIKCRHQDHRTGELREASHKHCKLIYCKHRIIRVVMLNLRGYDSHLIIIHAYAINNQIRIRKIDVIQNDIDKLMTYSIKHVKLKDSFQFMPSSFDEFVVNLFDEHDMFQKHLHVDSIFPTTWIPYSRKASIHTSG